MPFRHSSNEIFMSFLAILYISLSLVAGYIGRDRVIGFVGFTLVSLILSPLVAWIILLVTKPKVSDV